jgi:predicted nucleotidyltransferase
MHQKSLVYLAEDVENCVDDIPNWNTANKLSFWLERKKRFSYISVEWMNVSK